jgi:CO dehydrogenase/acetyl-CoA synthase beta subunit
VRLFLVKEEEDEEEEEEEAAAAAATTTTTTTTFGFKMGMHLMQLLNGVRHCNSHHAYSTAVVRRSRWPCGLKRTSAAA